MDYSITSYSVEVKKTESRYCMVHAIGVWSFIVAPLILLIKCKIFIKLLNLGTEVIVDEKEEILF